MNIAFVSPFFGAEATGGAETECRNTAIRLAAAGMNVEILTTCSRDLQQNWHINYHSRGTYHEDGLIVRRFPVEPVDLGVLDGLNTRIINGEPLSMEQEQLFMSLHVNSCDLYRYLASRTSDYDWICFIPYLFGTTVNGSLLCPEKSILIPCLHDEGYARMDSIKNLFRRCAGIVFHTHAEKDLAVHLYENLPGRTLLIGEGIDTDLTYDAERFRRKYNIPGPFVFYAGRKDKEKNVHALIRYFTAYKERHPNNLKLILAGPVSLPIPVHMKDEIMDLGFIPRQDKNDAYSAADIFCQPSLNESFSIVMMESWLCKTPCLVNGNCTVTREHVVQSGGGLYFENYADFEGTLNYLIHNQDMRRKMGENGRKYVLSHFSWETIIQKYMSEVFAK